MASPSPTPRPAGETSELPPETAYEFRLDFAQACLGNTQDLIRFMDEKAGFLLAAIGILTAALGTLVSKSFAGPMHSLWRRDLRVVAAAVSLAYLLLAFAVVYTAVQVYAARAHALRKASASPGLLFPLRLLREYNQDEDQYFARLAAAHPRELLHDYSNSMMETSNIYRIKQSRINRCVALFRWLCFLWLASMLALLILAL